MKEATEAGLADLDSENVQGVIRSVLDSNSSVDTFVCGNGEEALAVIEALNALDIEKEVICLDGDNDQLTVSVREGSVYATVVKPARELAEKILEVVLSYLQNGETLENAPTPTPRPSYDYDEDEYDDYNYNYNNYDYDDYDDYDNDDYDDGGSGSDSGNTDSGSGSGSDSGSDSSSGGTDGGSGSDSSQGGSSEGESSGGSDAGSTGGNGSDTGAESGN